MCSKITFLFFIIIGLTSVDAQDYPKIPADMHDYLLNMKIIADAGIQSRSDWRYVLQAGVLTQQNYKERVLKYDTLGRIQEIDINDLKGEKQSIKVIRYNSRSLPVMETEFMPTGELNSKTKYLYDSNGKLKDITWLNNNEFIIRKNLYEIDEEMKIVVEKQFISPDSAVKTTVFFYTDLSNGIVREVWYYNGEKNLDFKRIIIRNNENKIVREEFKNSVGELEYNIIYNYGTNGNILEAIIQYPDGTTMKKHDYKYNNSGLIVGEIEYNPAGDIVLYLKYSYDD